MRTYIYILCLMILCLPNLNSQVLGTNEVFDYIQSPMSARANALGGGLVTVRDCDIGNGLSNPALLNVKQHREIGVSHTFHFAGIGQNVLQYGHTLDSLKLSLHGGIQHIGYGSFDRADVFGNVNGEFKASEVAVFVGAAHQLNERITVGSTLRWMSANYDQYGAMALGLDLGLLYSNIDNTFATGAVVKNMGVVLNGFTDTDETVRKDIQIGLSKRLNHLPFRFGVTLHQLQQWNIRYKDPNVVQTDILGNDNEESTFAQNLDNLFRHVILNGEFLLGKREQFRLRLAYNHLRNKELSVLTFRSLTGFSFGFGINIKRFKIDYGMAFYHLEGATNQLSLRFNPFEYNKI